MTQSQKKGLSVLADVLIISYNFIFVSPFLEKIQKTVISTASLYILYFADWSGVFDYTTPIYQCIYYML